MYKNRGVNYTTFCLPEKATYIYRMKEALISIKTAIIYFVILI